MCQFRFRNNFFNLCVLIFITGAHDHMQPFDVDLWLTCMSRKSKTPPRLYPEEFGRYAFDIFDHCLNLSPRDVSHDNCRNIYVKLVEAFVNGNVRYSALGINSEEDDSE